MAVSEDGDATGAGSQSFLGRSYLTYLVPSTTNFKLDEALQHPDGPARAIEQIEKRESLFFGREYSLARHVKRALVSQLTHS
jgi:hypothetical protein